jgi:hypothetical protein
MAHIDPASVPAIDDDLETWLDVEGLCEDSSDDPGQNATTAQYDISSTLTSVQTPLDHNPQSEAQPAGQENRACPKSRRKTTTRTNPSVNYSVICFPSNPAKPDGIKKKRKDFDEKRRLEVAQVRKTGACFRCKVRRISVRAPSLTHEYPPEHGAWY